MFAPTSLLRILLLLSLLASTALSARAMGASDVDKVNASLKRAEANLQLVEGSIGHLTAPPKGSAAKLSRVRLDQALPDLQAAGKLVAGITAVALAFLLFAKTNPPATSDDDVVAEAEAGE